LRYATTGSGLPVEALAKFYIIKQYVSARASAWHGRCISPFAITHFERNTAMWQRLMYKLENLFAAVAFAEAGEFDAARELAEREPPQSGKGAKPTKTRHKPVARREAPAH
jgi:hypothetical protein